MLVFPATDPLSITVSGHRGRNASRFLPPGRLDPLADRHPLIVPAAFRKLDAVAVLTGPSLPVPLRKSRSARSVVLSSLSTTGFALSGPPHGCPCKSTTFRPSARVSQTKLSSHARRPVLAVPWNHAKGTGTPRSRRGGSAAAFGASGAVGTPEVGLSGVDRAIAFGGHFGCRAGRA